MCTWFQGSQSSGHHVVSYNLYVVSPIQFLSHTPIIIRMFVSSCLNQAFYGVGHGLHGHHKPLSCRCIHESRHTAPSHTIKLISINFDPVPNSDVSENIQTFSFFVLIEIIFHSSLRIPSILTSLEYLWIFLFIQLFYPSLFRLKF